MTLLQSAPRAPGAEAYPLVVTVELVDGNGRAVAGYVPGAEIVVEGRLQFTANGLNEYSPALGDWEVELQSNADIEPADTYYRITEQRGRSTAAIHYVDIPETGEYFLFDVLAELPGSLPSHLDSTTDVHGIPDTSELVDAAALAAEETRALAAEAALSADVSAATADVADLGTALDTEETARIAGDAAQAAALAAHAADTTGIHGIDDTSLLVDAATLALAINAEETRATAAEADIAADLTAEVAARTADVNAEETARIAAVTAEQTRASLAEAALTTAVTAEQTRALAAEAAVAASVTAETTARTADVNAEETRALAAEAALAADIDGLEVHLGQLDTAVGAEETARAAADAAETAARLAHEADTTAVHGIANTAALVVTSDARLSDQRVPTDNSVTQAKVAAGALGIDRLAVDPRARDTHTGTQTADTISDLTTAVRANRLDQMAAPTGPLSVNGQRVTNGVLPVASTDLITKEYADGLRAGLLLKADPVRVMVDTNVNVNSPGAVHDSVALNPGVDRLLLTGQTSGNDNGMYLYNGPAVPLTRTTDADTDAEMRSGTAVWVTEGTYQDQRWALVTSDPIDLGVTALAWAFDGGLAHVEAGAGTTKTGNRIDVGEGTGLEVLADSVGIADGGVDTDQLADDAVTADKLANNAVDTAAIQDAAVTLAKLGFDVATQAELNAVDTAVIHLTGDETVAGTKTWTGAQRITAGEPHYDAKGFGPMSTAAERRATLQAAVDAWGQTGGELTVHGTWDISGGTITLPPDPAASMGVVNGGGHALFSFVGKGNALISTESAHPILCDSNPATSAEASARTTRKFHFKNFGLKGTTLAGQVGLRLVGTYGAVIEDVYAQNLEDGIDLIFCLMASVRSCFGLQNTRYSFLARSGFGSWGDATDSNSGSNHSTFKDCRDYARAGQTAQFFIFGSSGVVLEDCITEGANPVNGIMFDGHGATTVKSFTVRNLHHENTASQSAIRIKDQTGGHVRLEDIWTGLGQVIIDSTGCGTSMALFADVPYFVPGSTPFKGDVSGNMWVFQYGFGGNDPRTPAMWVGGAVPTALAVHRLANATDAVGGQYMTLDGGNAVYVKGNYVILQGSTGAHSGGGPGVNVGTGTAPKVGFFGTVPIVKPTATPAASTDLASVIALANDLRSKLIALGLIA